MSEIRIGSLSFKNQCASRFSGTFISIGNVRVGIAIVYSIRLFDFRLTALFLVRFSITTT